MEVQVEALLLGMQMARACLRMINAKSQMLSGMVGILVGKLPDRYTKDWFAHLDEHSYIRTIFRHREDEGQLITRQHETGRGQGRRGRN